MAKSYVDKLTRLIDEVGLEAEVNGAMETRHFFSGAALYVNGTMRASLSPVGLAFKLPAAEVDALLERGEAKPLRYFPKGHIKKDYALFENPDLRQVDRWKPYFHRASQQT